MDDASSPLDRIEWPIRTDRLALRRATAADAAATWRFRRLESVQRWMTAAPATFDEYRLRFEDPGSLAVTLVIERDAEVIGDLMVAVEDAWAQTEVVDAARRVQAELGWVLDPGHVGQGYATEAVRALIDVCFSVVGLRRVTAVSFAENAASRRVMDRLGMRHESTLVRDALHRSGEWMDTVTYALLAEEWAVPGGESRR